MYILTVVLFRMFITVHIFGILVTNVSQREVRSSALSVIHCRTVSFVSGLVQTETGEETKLPIIFTEKF